MSLSAISIKRPVLTIVMSLVIILFGGIGYTFLGVREYPNVDPPVITVSTNYVGANADVMESQITEPLEESINGIDGIRSLTSVSRDGRSTIKVEFSIDVNLDNAANDVRDRVSRALFRLPKDVDPPTVSKADANQGPILFLSLKSNTRSLLALTDLAQNVLKERLQTIQGVSSIDIWGEKKYSMRLWMDPGKLTAYQLTPNDIRETLLKENIELPSGMIQGKNTELTVRTLGRLATPDDFNKLILKEYNGKTVRFSDVGFSELYPENDRTLLKRDGIPMVGVALNPLPGSNHIDIADEFYNRFNVIKKEIPSDVIPEIGFDNTKYIRESISEVEQTIFIAFGLVIFVIFLFFRTWRTTIIPIFAIPISLVGSFFIMYLAGYSINVLTMLGIVLAIGIVVDDAIVVLENIYKKIEEGMSPLDAAFKGSSEIFFAIIATTLTLVAVFLPIMFLSGLTGRLFREFGIVLAGSIMISAFVALTLTPMLSSKILKTHKSEGWLYTSTEPFFIFLNNLYKSSLNYFMSNRWLSFIIIAISGLFIYYFGSTLSNELAPLEDRGLIRLSSTAPEGSSFDYMLDYTNKWIKTIMDSVPEKNALISVTSPGFGASSSVNTVSFRLILKKRNERKRSQNEIAEWLSTVTSRYNDASTFVIEEQSIGTNRGGLPIQYVLKAPNLEKLKEVIPKFLSEARKSPVFKMVDVNLKFNKPEITVEINREKAREVGVSTSDIAQTLQLALAGQRFDYFIMNGKQYQVIGQLSREHRNKPVDIKSLNVRSSSGRMIQLDNLIYTKDQSSPPQLFRFNRFLSATVSASLSPGKTIGDGINEMDKIALKVLDESVSTALDGASKDFMESSSTLLFTFLLSLVLIYLVLAAQFESFRDPFIIMITVPLALAGSLLSLYVFNQSLNIFSQIGQIMLIGLVTKNGILIVEFANQIRIKGTDKITAVKEAAILRFRPIIMTSLTTILGTLPIALALGAGSESRISMGIAIVAGLTFSTILTLFIIPAMYSFISKKDIKFIE